MGKATAAAKRVFGIVEYPSRIDAQAMDEDTSYKRIETSEVTGKLEFKDVWFRYPTRKQDFVLKGLNLTINPNEVIALVGESGCGKSTIVNLLMRFYDVDSG
jgi:ATP-binding cassette subfamily B (MDR/TAP) protein 1